MQTHQKLFIQQVKNPLKFKLLLWLKLPLAALTGVKMVEATEQKISVQTKYKWLNKNPFNTMYWAVLGMSAELCSGLLVMMHSYKLKPGIAMYVVRCQAKFVKRAFGKILFVCNDGDFINQEIETCIKNHSSKTIETTTIAYNENHEIVAEFVFTWSVKGRK